MFAGPFRGGHSRVGSLFNLLLLYEVDGAEIDVAVQVYEENKKP